LTKKALSSSTDLLQSSKLQMFVSLHKHHNKQDGIIFQTVAL